jgi:hypothetical protein
MFNPIEVPFNCKMLFNVVKLKEAYTIDDAEMAMGEMCNVVKNTYRDSGGFIAGQVFKSAGFVSDEGSLGGSGTDKHGCISEELTKEHIVILTYWNSFDQHETSHADDTFKEKFNNLKEMCDDTFEIGYDMLWQGEPE